MNLIYFIHPKKIHLMKNKILPSWIPLSIAIIIFSISASYTQNGQDSTITSETNNKERPTQVFARENEESEMPNNITGTTKLNTYSLSAERILNMMQERNCRLEELPTMVSPSNWTLLGPSSPTIRNVGLGRINRVAVHPTDPSIIFAVSDNGGIWKKVGTNAWTNLTDNWALLGAGTLAINPANPNIMYASTGSLNSYAPPSLGIQKTVDGGINWTLLSLSGINRIQDVVIHPTNPDILIANTYYGLYRSADAGVNWTLVKDYIGGEQPGNICFKPNDPNIVYACIYDKVFKSNDAGLTWNALNTPPEVDFLYSNIAVTPANPNLLFLAQRIRFGFNGLFVSSDGGATFTQIASPSSTVSFPCAPTVTSNLASQLSNTGGRLQVAVSPTDANNIYFGQVFMCSSSDGGVTWNSIQGCGYPQGPYVDNQEIKFHPLTGDVYVASDGGLNRYKVSTQSWELLHNNLPVALQYALAVSPNGNRILVGNQDVQTSVFDRASNQWNYAEGTMGDGQQPVFAPSNGSICYASMQSGEQLYRSTDGGLNFTLLTQPSQMLTENGPFEFTAIQVHPTNPSIVFVGKRNLWKTQDAGLTWTKISNFSTFNPSGTPLTWCIKVAPSNPNIIYVSNNVTGSLFKTIDGGVNWTECQHPPALYFRAIDVDNLNPNIIWGITGIVYTQTWKSTNGGNTWINYDNGLPDNLAKTIVFQKGTNGGVYLGTNIGVYYRDNSMSSWIPFNIGLPNVVVYDLEIDYAHSKIIGATYGRSMWESPLFSIPLPLDLVAFSAVLKGNKVLLTWQTANETNVKNFDIEKSTDGTNFSKIKEVKANNMPSTYQNFDDNFIESAYYRLKTHDLDGKTEDSKIVFVDKTKTKGIKISKNTEGPLSIETDDIIEFVTVTNLLGQVLKTTKEQRFSISDLPSAIYIISVKTDKGYLSEKVNKF
jgi:photosystem II stability/assembly factor-like uncharacterized protein